MYSKIDVQHSRSYTQNNHKPHYKINKVTYLNGEGRRESILFTATSNLRFMGFAHIYGNREQAQLELIVPKSFQSWGIEAHLLFYILQVAHKKNISRISIIPFIRDETLINILLAMGFEISEYDEDLNKIELTLLMDTHAN